MALPRIQSDLTMEDTERLSRARLVAVDTETTGLNPNRDLLCLVQIYDESGETVIVRNRDWNTCSNLRELLALPSVTKVMHYALFDCSFLQQNLKVEISNIYCTRIASKLARTYSSSHGLKDLAEELLGVSIDKSQQTTFWCRDNLTEEQIVYASNDVKYLIPLREKLNEILVSKGRLPSGISYLELNRRCQEMIPTLVHLRLNGWEIPRDLSSGWIF